MSSTDPSSPRSRDQLCVERSIRPIGAQPYLTLGNPEQERLGRSGHVLGAFGPENAGIGRHRVNGRIV